MRYNPAAENQMWIFTRYGFFSVVCAKSFHGFVNSDPLEVIHKDRVMIRARRMENMQALQRRFPELSSADILKLDGHDYAYRIILVKELWSSVVGELVREQTWSNFKSEVANFQGAAGMEYTNALHRVWSVMKEYQESATTEGEDGTNENASDEPAALWDGIIQTGVMSDKEKIESSCLAKNHLTANESHFRFDLVKQQLRTFD